jgi:hypothetical protein
MTVAAGLEKAGAVRAAMFAALMLACVRPAIAQPLPDSVVLEWYAPPGCPDRERARAAIAAALGERARAGTGRTVVRVQIAQRLDARWNADLWMYGAQGSGERTLTGASCADVTEATALIVAMALESNAEALDEPTPAARADADAQRGERMHFELGVHAAGDVGSLPEPTAGAGLGVGLAYGRLQLALDATAWLPQDEHSGEADRVGGRFGLFTAALRGCFAAAQLAARALRLGPCLGLEAGVATGEGVGNTDPESRSHLWAAGLLGLSAQLALGGGPFGVELRAELGVPMRRPIWEIPDFADVFQASPWLGRAALGAAYRFP